MNISLLTERSQAQSSTRTGLLRSRPRPFGISGGRTTTKKGANTRTTNPGRVAPSDGVQRRAATPSGVIVQFPLFPRVAALAATLGCDTEPRCGSCLERPALNSFSANDAQSLNPEPRNV